MTEIENKLDKRDAATRATSGARGRLTLVTETRDLRIRRLVGPGVHTFVLTIIFITPMKIRR